MDLLIQLFAVVGGFAVLMKASDIFCTQAIKLASLAGVSTLLISMTLIPLGTSAPELFVSVVAALDNVPLLATGNVLGSNILNIALGLGIAATIHPIIVNRDIIKLELPIMIMTSLLFGWMIMNLHLSLLNGVLLISGMLLTLVAIIYREKRSQRKNSDTTETAHNSNTRWQQIIIVLGIFIAMGVLLYLSSSAVVWGASGIATYFGVSELLIGLTVVAVGTSLPEITVTAASVIKRHYDVALGNIIGSNNINLLAVLGTTAIIQPHQLPEVTLWRDYLLMLALSLLVGIFCYCKFSKKPAQIKRSHGVLFIAIYLGYIACLIYT